MAVIGAVMIFVCRIVSPQSAIESVDFNMLVLLFAMMPIVTSLHLAGFFDWVANRVILHLSPRQLLPGVVYTSGILSAFLVNDVVCLFMAPLILDICKRRCPSASLPARSRHRLQHRRSRDDYRQSTEHSDRFGVGNRLPPFSGTHMWLMLSVASTLAGNLTITGSVANIIVVPAP